MPTNDEKFAFAKRLARALRRSPEPVEGATELALRFNLRHKGEPISPQTAHKWLSGRAIPTNDKLVTISDWLKVDQHWLQYGPPPTKLQSSVKDKNAKGVFKPSPEVLSIAMRIQELPPHRRYFVEELVGLLEQGVE